MLHMIYCERPRRQYYNLHLYIETQLHGYFNPINYIKMQLVSNRFIQPYEILC